MCPVAGWLGLTSPVVQAWTNHGHNSSSPDDCFYTTDRKLKWGWQTVHCRCPWEPDQCASREKQDKMLENLIAWVVGKREVEYGLARHRAIYDNYQGARQEYH